jgi:flagellar basal body-associated protein FliL
MDFSNFSDKKNKIPGRVPEGYFESLPDIMVNKVKTEKKSGNSTGISILYAIAGVAAVIVLVFILRYSGNDTETANLNSDNSQDSIVHASELTQNNAHQSKDSTATHQKVIHNHKDHSDTTYTEEDIIEYLLDEGFDEI